MSTPPVADVSSQKKANRRKSKKASVEGASSPTDVNHVNEATVLTLEQMNPASDLKRENEAIKEISR